MRRVKRRFNDYHISPVTLLISGTMGLFIFFYWLCQHGMKLELRSFHDINHGPPKRTEWLICTIMAIRFRPKQVSSTSQPCLMIRVESLGKVNVSN